MPSYVEDFLGPVEDAEGDARFAHHVQEPSSDPDKCSRISAVAEDCAHVSVPESASSGGRSPYDPAGVKRLDTYEDDPPWDEVIESMQNAGDPLPTVTYVRPSLPAEFRVPTTPEEMYRSLVFLSKPSVTGTTQPFEFLHHYHDSYPELHTTRSYNFLIGLAMGCGELDTAARLLQRMYHRDLTDDLETRVLRVRLMVRQGLWGEAWETQVAQGPLPLPVWLEFFGTIKHNDQKVMDIAALQQYLMQKGPPPPQKGGTTIQQGPRSARSPQQDFDDPIPPTQPPSHATLPEHADGVEGAPYSIRGDLGVDVLSGLSPADKPMSAGATVPVRDPSDDKWNADGLWFGRQRAEGDSWRRPVPPPPPSLSTELGRYETLMRSFPALTAKETACMPPRVMQTLVKWFVRTGNRAGAFDTTKAYVAGLPERLSRGDMEACLKMIHPQLVPAKENLTGYFKARKTLDALLKLHADLRPDATTLVYLLNSLRTTTRCGTLGLELVSQFRRRYGQAVVDERVRWRLAWLALKQRQVRIALSVLAEHERAAKRERARRQLEGLEREFGAPQAPEGMPARPAFHEVFAARELEQYWTPLRDRLRRMMARAKAKQAAR